MNSCWVKNYCKKSVLIVFNFAPGKSVSQSLASVIAWFSVEHKVKLTFSFINCFNTKKIINILSKHFSWPSSSQLQKNPQLAVRCQSGQDAQ